MKTYPNILVAAALLPLANSTLLADTVEWIGDGADNNITTTDNWYGSKVPGSGDEVYYISDAHQHYTMGISSDWAVSAFEISTLLDGSTPAISQTSGNVTTKTFRIQGIGTFDTTYGGVYNLSGGSFSTTSWAVLGGNGNLGTINHSGGAFSVGGELTVGEKNGENQGVGIYNLSDSGTLTVTGEM